MPGECAGSWLHLQPSPAMVRRSTAGRPLYDRPKVTRLPGCRWALRESALGRSTLGDPATENELRRFRHGRRPTPRSAPDDPGRPKEKGPFSLCRGYEWPFRRPRPNHYAGPTSASGHPALHPSLVRPAWFP